MALLYSGSDGSGWRAGNEETVNDFALKFRYKLTPTLEVFGKTSHYDVKSRTSGGLTVAQYNTDPFQNTRPTDFWSGTRKGLDISYLNTLSDTQEFKIRTFYNEIFRQSVLEFGANLVQQPRNYEVQAIVSGVQTPQITFNNATDAQAAYIDDKISFGTWRITPGLRFEHIHSTRNDLSAQQTFQTTNNKPLPSVSIAYLLNRDITLFTNYTASFGPVQNLQLNSQTPINPMTPELAKTIEASARWKSKQLSAEFTVCNTRFDNQIQQVPGTLPETFMNIDKTKHDGVETVIDYAFAKDGSRAGLSVFANYTYTRAL